MWTPLEYHEDDKDLKERVCLIFSWGIWQKILNNFYLYSIVSNRVLNTDNMSIVGATIDYGPYGFMDNYDPEFICNGSGKYGRHQNTQFCRKGLFTLKDSVKNFTLTIKMGRQPIQPSTLPIKKFKSDTCQHYSDGDKSRLMWIDLKACLHITSPSGCPSKFNVFFSIVMVILMGKMCWTPILSVKVFIKKMPHRNGYIYV